jgi:hypothetical protein
MLIIGFSVHTQPNAHQSVVILLLTGFYFFSCAGSWLCGAVQQVDFLYLLPVGKYTGLCCNSYSWRSFFYNWGGREGWLPGAAWPPARAGDWLYPCTKP